jgi:hypothetical protein
MEIKVDLPRRVIFYDIIFLHIKCSYNIRVTFLIV